MSQRYPAAYNKFIEGGFLVEEDTDESALVNKSRMDEINDTNMLHVIVNPTLDCNLSCWYCYEHKVAHSKMADATIQGICNFIVSHYEAHPFLLLKLSFFGGEPFMRQDVIKKIIEYAADFCKKKALKLLLDFTTNGTLLTQSMLDFLKDYACIFQITFDGNREKHNSIKFTGLKDSDAYSMTLRNIYRIQESIPDSFTAVRINFDADTLNDFDSILSDLDGLNRLKTKIILKKVWQVDCEKVSSSQIYEVLEKLINRQFIVDYYSQGGVCFADRKNQVTFNYDGKVYKCTTISHFDEENALGQLNFENGQIDWDREKTKYLSNSNMQAKCQDCCLFPKCGGPCRKQISEGAKDNCFLDDVNLSPEEYALILFKVEFLKSKLYAKKVS
jgi:uncharacterized protein